MQLPEGCVVLRDASVPYSSMRDVDTVWAHVRNKQERITEARLMAQEFLQRQEQYYIYELPRPPKWRPQDFPRGYEIKETRPVENQDMIVDKPTTADRMKFYRAGSGQSTGFDAVKDIRREKQLMELERRKERVAEEIKKLNQNNTKPRNFASQRKLQLSISGRRINPALKKEMPEVCLRTIKPRLEIPREPTLGPYPHVVYDKDRVIKKYSVRPEGTNNVTQATSPYCGDRYSEKLAKHLRDSKDAYGTGEPSFTARYGRAVNVLRNTSSVLLGASNAKPKVKPLSAKFEHFRQKCFSTNTPICFHKESSFTNEKWIEEAYENGFIEHDLKCLGCYHTQPKPPIARAKTAQLVKKEEEIQIITPPASAVPSAINSLKRPMSSPHAGLRCIRTSPVIRF